MKIKSIIFVFFLFISLAGFCQEPYVEKGIIIIHSSKDYESAKRVVKDANKQMNFKIDLRGYYKGKKQPLVTDQICGCGQKHDYVARGRWDDGNYISIEYSDRYQGFSKGYYIVVIASGDKDNEEMKKAWATAKGFYPDAYLKSTEVYIGCIH